MNNLHKIISKSNIISFDIFDTLILRPYIKPIDLFKHMEVFFGAIGFAENRIKAEISARKTLNKAEITFDDIYNFIDEKYKNLKSKELDFEFQVLQPNNEIKKIYYDSLNLGKTIIITSDMYLSKDVIEKILDKTGYTNYSKLYLSSDKQKTKNNGDIFELIKSDYGTNKILHIGDNKNSDYINAKKHGLRAFYYQRPIKKYIDTSPRIKKFITTHPENLFSSILIGVLSIYKQNANYNNYWEKVGFEYAGPSIYTYVNWLNKQFQKDSINEALFIARDGYSLQKVYDIIKTSNTTKTYYLYAPRILNLICNLDFESQLAHGGWDASAAISTVIDYFKDSEYFSALDIPKQNNLNGQIEFVKTHLEAYKKLSNTERENYISYLHSINLSKSNKTAIIDTISGFLSSQKFLESMLNKKITGYYWVIWASTDISKHNVSTLQNEREMLFHEWNLMEFFMTAPTPPIQNVINNKPKFKPVLPYEQARIDVYPFISNAAIEFAKTVKYIFADIDIFSDYKVLIDWINGLVDSPTKEDKEHFINIKHAYDANHVQFIPICTRWYHNHYETYKKYCLLKIIPLLTIKHKNRPRTKKYFLFGLFPIWKIKHTKYHIKYYLFDCICIKKVENK